jgi:hypothetical protein
MKTHIKTIHEEAYSDGSRTLGVLLNFSSEILFEHDDWKDSLIYIYHNKNYIFFSTMIDMIDYLLYGDKKVKTAYLDEEEFDEYYDAEFIEGVFAEKLKWQ